MKEHTYQLRTEPLARDGFCLGPQPQAGRHHVPPGWEAGVPVTMTTVLSLSAPETQDQVLLPVGWSHRPAGHRPHHRHLSPKVTPPAVSAPAAPTPSSLHPSTHLSVHPLSSVSGVGSALTTQQGTGQVGGRPCWTPQPKGRPTRSSPSCRHGLPTGPDPQLPRASW